MSVDWRLKLRDDLFLLPFEVSDCARQQLEVYIECLCRWSRQRNLTAVRSHSEMVTKHILDCLSVVPFLPQPYLELPCAGAASVDDIAMIDVGTGAGLPGLLLAILQPQSSWYLVDANTKKLQFVQYMCAQLQINNVRVVNGRIEQLGHENLAIQKGQKKFIISRAFAPIMKTLQYLQNWLESGQLIYFMLGKYPNLSAVPKTDFVIAGCHALNVPGLDAERHLCILQKI